MLHAQQMFWYGTPFYPLKEGLWGETNQKGI